MPRRRPYWFWLSRHEWERICLEHDYRCVLCGTPGTSKTLERDHIVPHARGGADAPENIQPLCHECNFLKMAWLEHEMPDPWPYWEWGAHADMGHLEWQQICRPILEEQRRARRARKKLERSKRL